MNVLDENIVEAQWHLLLSRRIPVRKVGEDCGRSGMTDEEIIPFLHHQKPVTFFTRDQDFFRRHLCHPAYCLVYLDVCAREVASFVRRFLRHPAFRSWSKRKGKVIRVGHRGMRVWRLHGGTPEVLSWSTGGRLK
jgi:hypothetical protein